MGWLKEHFNLKKIVQVVQGAPPIELIFVPSISTQVIRGIGEAIIPDSCYIELYLDSLRLEQARIFATSFQGIVYSFVTLSREGEEPAHLAAVSKPEKLAELDPNSLNNVISISKKMMGPIAFRGGTVSLEIGLFSVKSGNLLNPILDYVTRVSSVAGISNVGAIKPFVPLITEGMDMIAGQKQDTALEVGVDTDIDLTNSCVAAIIAKPKTSIVTSQLSLDNDFRLLLNGQPLNCGYAVFSLRQVQQKSDYGEIPEIKEKYSAFQSAIRGNKKEDAHNALTAFRLATIASPDLISSDARRLVEKAQEKYDEAFPPGGEAGIGIGKTVEKLSEIGLYD